MLLQTTTNAPHHKPAEPRLDAPLLPNEPPALCAPLPLLPTSDGSEDSPPVAAGDDSDPPPPPQSPPELPLPASPAPPPMPPAPLPAALYADDENAPLLLLWEKMEAVPPAADPGGVVTAVSPEPTGPAPLVER